MNRNRQLLLFSAAICLFLITIACEISFPTSEKEENALSDVEIAEAAQVQLKTAVAKTVEALTPPEIDDSVEVDEPESEGADEEPPAATATPLPCNKPNFQSETIPDNSEFDPGDTFTKTWTVRNDGTCTWTTDYSFVFISGDQMGGASSKTFSSKVEPGDTVTLSVDLTAPSDDGTYSGSWKIKSDDGEKFGNYWTTIIVGEPGSGPGEAFAVTRVTFNGSDQMKVGGCPLMFNFQAQITANGAGKVKYHWMISSGYEGSVESITFDEEETKTVTLSKNIGCGGTCTYLIDLYIDSPNHQLFGSWPIALHCF